MTAHGNGSGPRSNDCSENRFTNWSEYEPWWLEVQTVFKRFDGRIAKRPDFPKITGLPPLAGFIKPCSAREIEAQLTNCPPGILKGLRAVFVMSGTVKQLKSWGRATTCYGGHWNRCVFLHACPFGRAELVSLHRFYPRNMRMHEIGHHLDARNLAIKDRERFARQFARTRG
jgi:hypothetical protein